MKILFLDHDGVICLQNNWGSRFKKQKKENVNFLANDPSVPVKYRFDNFDLKSVKILNSILEETDAEIVISSDWKQYATLDELRDYYEYQGIIKSPIGVTETFHYTNWKNNGFLPKDNEFPWSRDFNLEQERHFEIIKWLKDHSGVTHWVSVDDLDMSKRNGREWGLLNFVLCPKSNEGIKQTGIKEKIIDFLS